MAEFQVHPFPPVFDAASRILILGSFPSVKSRAEQFFYAHPQNRFWRVLSALLGQPCPVTIPEKRAFLLSSHIALWDVIASCNIEGSINHSIISTGCSVGKGAEITDSVIMPDVVIENGAVIRSAIIAEGCHIKAGARVGDYVEGEERKISVIGKDKIIAEGTVIDAGAIV